MILKIEKADDSTFTIFTGKDGDPAQPLPWPGFDFYLTGQLGLIASPTWLAAVDADPTQATSPVGSGPFIVQSYAPRDALVVTKNPNYWQKDANGVALPYLDKITFKVIEDSTTAGRRTRAVATSTSSPTRTQPVIADFIDDTDFPMTQTTDYVETNFLPGRRSQGRPVRRCPRQVCVVDGARPSGTDRPRRWRSVAAGQRRVLTGPGGLPRRQRLQHGARHRRRQGVDRRLPDRQPRAGARSRYGHTADRTGDQQADLIKGYWSEIGVETTVETIPQDQFITNALFGADTYYIYAWRQHAGLNVDQQNFWWNSRSAAPDGALSLNFARIQDPIVDENLAIARSSTDEAARKAAAEAINTQMAKECYQIPWSYTLWATIHTPEIQGLAETTLPDGGGTAQDGAGFPGQFWVNGLWVQQG